MRVWTSLGMCALAVGGCKERATTSADADVQQPVVFQGSVTKVEPLASHVGAVYAVGETDPRFAVTVHVESLESVSNGGLGTDPVFAIHSPSRTFQTSETLPSGRYRFVYQRAAHLDVTLTAER